MTSRLKKYTIFLLCTALLHAALFSPTQLIAEQAIPVHEACETVQATETQENNTQKPTILESWRKVVTLRWKELGKADAWNIGAPIASITTFGLLAYSYWPKNIIAGNNNHNLDNNNPGSGTHIPPIIPTNNHVDDNTHVLNSTNTLNPGLNNNQNQPLANTNDLSSSSSSDDSNDSSSSSDSDNSDSDLSSDDEYFMHMFLNTIVNNPNGHRLLNAIANNDADQDLLLFNLMTNNLDSDTSSSSSSDDTDDNIDHQLMLLTQEQRNNIAQLWDNEILIDDIQNKIALDMITDFLTIPITLEGHTYRVLSAAISDNKVIAGSWNDIAKIWDIDTGLLQHTLQGHTDTVYSVAISGGIAVTGSADNTAKIWNTNTGQLLHTLAGHNGWVNSVVISGNIVVTGSNDNTAKIWNIDTGKLLHTLQGHTNSVYSVAISGSFAVTGSSDTTAKIWNTNTGQLLHTFTEHNGWVNSVAISNNIVVTGSHDNTVKIWDINTNQLIKTLEVDRYISSVIINGNKVIIGLNDRTVTIWDIHNDKLPYTLAGHNRYDNLVTICGDKLITESHNNNSTIKIWPLSVDLNTPEFNNPEHALYWIKRNLLPMQANLIARAYAVYNFKINNTDDAHIWITFPAHVREYLSEHLNIRLSNRIKKWSF